MSLLNHECAVHFRICHHIFSVCVCSIGVPLGESEHHLRSLFYPRTDCMAWKMDSCLCWRQSSWMVGRGKMRLPANFRWLLATFVLLYLLNQVNSQKKGKYISLTEREQNFSFVSIFPVGKKSSFFLHGFGDQKSIFLQSLLF